jgi:hypothetical protein
MLIAKDQEEVYRRMSEENSELKDCLRVLQREMMDVVCLKQDMFTQRVKAEYGAGKEVQMETEESLRNKIQLVRDELFNQGFEESGQDIIAKFKLNF